MSFKSIHRIYERIVLAKVLFAEILAPVRARFQQIFEKWYLIWKMVWKIVLNVKSKIPTQATTKIKLKLVKHLDWHNMPNADHISVTLLQIKAWIVIQNWYLIALLFNRQILKPLFVPSRKWYTDDDWISSEQNLFWCVG